MSYNFIGSYLMLFAVVTPCYRWKGPIVEGSSDAK